MRDSTCKNLAYGTTLVTLPVLALSVILGSAANWLNSECVRFFVAILMIGAGISYIASLVLTVTYGFLSRRSPILFTPTASLVLIALFVGFLPDNVRQDPWRPIDILIFAGLAALNIAQILALRRRAPAATGGHSR